MSMHSRFIREREGPQKTKTATLRSIYGCESRLNMRGNSKAQELRRLAGTESGTRRSTRSIAGDSQEGPAKMVRSREEDGQRAGTVSEAGDVSEG